MTSLLYLMKKTPLPILLRKGSAISRLLALPPDGACRCRDLPRSKRSTRGK